MTNREQIKNLAKEMYHNYGPDLLAANEGEMTREEMVDCVRDRMHDEIGMYDGYKDVNPDLKEFWDGLSTEGAVALLKEVFTDSEYVL